MINPNKFKKHTLSNQGFTLVELLISLLLGIMVTVIMLTMLAAGWHTYKTSNEYSNTNSIVRSAFNFLRINISQAGFQKEPWVDPLLVFETIAAGDAFTDGPAFEPGQIAAVIADPATGQDGHRIYVRKEGINTANDNVESLIDCRGGAIVNNTIVYEVYYVSDDELLCDTAISVIGDASQTDPTETDDPVVISDNIDSINVRVGLTDTTTKAVTGYVAPNNAGINWVDVNSMQIALVVTNDSSLVSIDGGTDQVTVDVFGDNRIITTEYATVLTQTVTLKNRSF